MCSFHYVEVCSFYLLFLQGFFHDGLLVAFSVYIRMIMCPEEHPCVFIYSVLHMLDHHCSPDM